jgi:hypothetical protein
MTRNRWIVAVVLPLAVLLALPLIASAGSVPPGGKRHYKGTTSQGGRSVSFTTERKGGTWAVSDLNFGLRMRCDDGTHFDLETGYGFGSPIVLDSKDRFAFDDNEFGQAIHVHGRLGPKKGSGTVELKIATLTQDEQPELCTSKIRDWSVTRVVTPTPSPTPTVVPGTAKRTVQVTFDASGQAHVSRSW